MNILNSIHYSYNFENKLRLLKNIGVYYIYIYVYEYILYIMFNIIFMFILFIKIRFMIRLLIGC